MSHHVQNVVIVGGGSAGWMTAAYLSKALKKNVQITLVESSNITKVGVGEATFSSIKSFFDFLGLQEYEWMPKCNATYKMGIKFVDWNSDRRHFYHPFERFDFIDGFSISEWWLKLKSANEPFDYSCFMAPTLCDRQRSPRYLNGKIFDDRVEHLFSEKHFSEKNLITLADAEGQYPYAYHFDANLIARFLKDYSIQRGVKQIVDDVVDVNLTEDGSIDSLNTNEHGIISGDLFIDCSGFRGLLINKALGEPFISYSESLLCDSRDRHTDTKRYSEKWHQPLHNCNRSLIRLGLEYTFVWQRWYRVCLFQRLHLCTGSRTRISPASRKCR